MTAAAPALQPIRIPLARAADTARLAERLAPQLGAGDVVLVSGPIGAGKSHFCRSLIQARLAAAGRMEDVPSPTYTLVQVYDLPGLEIWHADLYRLTVPDEVLELGLDEAFDTAICLVEWPDRLGEAQPENALFLRLEPQGHTDTRVAVLSATDPRWRPVLAGLAQPGGRPA